HTVSRENSPASRWIWPAELGWHLHRDVGGHPQLSGLGHNQCFPERQMLAARKLEHGLPQHRRLGLWHLGDIGIHVLGELFAAQSDRLRVPGNDCGKTSVRPELESRMSR